MNWANRICQSLFLINLIYAIVSFISNGQFLPIIPLEELFAALMFIATGIYILKNNRVLSFLLLFLGLVLLINSKDFLGIFLSNNTLNNIYINLGQINTGAEIGLLICIAVFKVYEVLKNKKEQFTSVFFPVAMLSVIIIALLFTVQYDYLLYFAYLALGLSSFILVRLYIKEPFGEEWNKKYNVFGYHALLIVTNLFAFI
jgi:hypothetical protein